MTCIDQGNKYQRIAKRVADISHEFNNPLSTLIGALETLQKSSVEQNAKNNNSNALLNIALRASQRMREIGEVITHLAQECPRQQNQAPVDIANEIKKSVYFYKPLLRSLNVNLKIDIDESLHFKNLDPHLIHQLVGSIIDLALIRLERNDANVIDHEVSLYCNLDKKTDNLIIGDHDGSRFICNLPVNKFNATVAA